MQTKARVKTPQIVVVSGPMAGGKSSVIPVVLDSLNELDTLFWGKGRVLDISDTTRGCRVDHGEHPEAYNFDTPRLEMEKNISKGVYIQYSPHSGELYGSKIPADGQPIIMDIEVSGVRQIVESTIPQVIKARKDIKAIYLLQSSMEDLYSQMMNRLDGMSEERKLLRIARYPAEIRYIMDHNLPYTFVLNEAGRIDRTKQHVSKFMLGKDDTMATQGPEMALSKALEAEEWLRKRGVEPAKIIDPIGHSSAKLKV
jgi:guanylate kinase